MTKKDKLSVEPYKGVRDFYPEEQAFLNYFIATCREFVEKVGYVEYDASPLEPSELYKAKGAENEEMVNEQTYTFVDRGGREVTLRPEMTPTVARMVAGKRRELGFPLRWYSLPNCFRYERPQRGRLREFWQLNVDLFGSHSPYADAEIIAMAYGLMKAFGAEDDDFVIKVNSRAYLNKLTEKLSDEARKKLFNLLDRKTKMPSDEFEAGLRELAISPERFMSAEGPAEIEKMIREFSDAGIKNIIYDPSIVRGFAYYTGMVFEVFDTHPDNNRALFGGGRYDNLTAMFDDEPVAGVGFGMGDVTIRDFLAVRNLLPVYAPPTHVYIAIPSSELALQAQTFAGSLRQQGVNVAVDFGEKKLGDQIKTAAKHNIPFVIVLGQDELASGQYTVRDLETGSEKKLDKGQLSEFFLNIERK
ncbi:MAG: histidine--tRNA ligase [Patescibacteria group bacterium]|nr:histidine--tRNA ligase [Patescibacteria group bacterium]